MSKTKNKNPTEIYTIDECLEKLGIKNWDALIIGDGSGSTWQRAAGWGAIVIDRATNIYRNLCGSFNIGTSTIAEIIPYVYSMVWYTTNGPGHSLLRRYKAEHKNPQIIIISDSTFVVECGNRASARHSHHALWAAIDEFRKEGYVLNFYHLHRNKLFMNVLMDSVAREARMSIDGCYDQALKFLTKKYDLPERTTARDFLV